MTQLVLGLSAVVVAATEDAPFVLVTRDRDQALTSLPFGLFDPAGDRTLELTLRKWVTAQTGFEIGYVEQLYTFGDRGREAPLAADADRVLSIGYLALAPDKVTVVAAGAGWRDWYDYFPWEDWRNGRPAVIDAAIAPRLREWAGANPERDARRFEGRDGVEIEATPISAGLGEPMRSDHRRILATAISRLRGKLKYRPVVFELMPERFTLLHLQRVVEAISGIELHKQNFRRLLERGTLVVGTGELEARTGGRPAELFRFRREVLRERPVGGFHVPAPKGASGD
ncbi:MAG: hypothetical protein FD124_44 [Alphaproteobacteria bacterium]|nr:MAG: hypothetical protein FD124_44 [Alphaproteobacteria bacterium]